jgi:hypothetical protein
MAAILTSLMAHAADQKTRALWKRENDALLTFLLMLGGKEVIVPLCKESFVFFY